MVQCDGTATFGGDYKVIGVVVLPVHRIQVHLALCAVRKSVLNNTNEMMSCYWYI
jgi:hypothetical protein